MELVARVVFPFEEHIGINEVTAPLKTDVPRCVDPRIHVIRVRCNEDVYAALIERRTGERHIVFPADKTAKWPPRALHRWEISTIRVAPNKPLRTGRLEFTVHRGKHPIGRKHDIRVVKCPRRIIALGHTDAEVDMVLLCRCAKRLRLRAWADNRVIVI